MEQQAQVFYHIAVANEQGAAELCRKYGFNDCQNEEDGADALSQIAATSEEHFKQVMELHPEKDVILALFSSQKNNDLPRRRYMNFSGEEDGCSCGQCAGCGGQRRINLNDMFIRTNQADGGTGLTSTTAPGNTSIAGIHLQTNTLIFISIITLIGVAVYIKNK